MDRQSSADGDRGVCEPDEFTAGRCVRRARDAPYDQATPSHPEPMNDASDGSIDKKTNTTPVSPRKERVRFGSGSLATPRDLSTSNPEMTAATVLLPNRWVKSWPPQPIHSQTPQRASIAVECKADDFPGAARTQQARPLRAASTADGNDLAYMKLASSGLAISDAQGKSRLRNHAERHDSAPQQSTEENSSHRFASRNGSMSPRPQYSLLPQIGQSSEDRCPGFRSAPR
jgi:hypothetical protein